MNEVFLFGVLHIVQPLLDLSTRTPTKVHTASFHHWRAINVPHRAACSPHLSRTVAEEMMRRKKVGKQRRESREELRVCDTRHGAAARDGRKPRTFHSDRVCVQSTVWPMDVTSWQSCPFTCSEYSVL